MKISQDFGLKATAALVLVGLLGTWAPAQERSQPIKVHHSKSPLHGEARHKTNVRRIIVNDDGALRVGDNVMKRFQGVLNTQVDSYFLCIGQTSVGSGPGVEGVPGLDNTQAWWQAENKPPGLDELTRAHLRTARQAGLEIFASFRMNDIHDSFAGKPVYPLKARRPDLLLGEGKPYPEDAVMRAFWSGFNYAKQEVRDHFRDFILSYCRHYDYDGVELDYFRHPLFFKLGEEEANLENMTEFVRQVREGLNEIGRDRRRPYLLTARVPDALELSLRTGLDVEQWLKDGLLDLLIIGGGYMPYAGRYKELIDLAHRYGVPAYPCINHFQMQGLEGRDPSNLRAMASNFWALGADGVYIFNYFGTREGSEHHQCLKQMGDPDALMRLDKQYLPDDGLSVHYLGHINPPPQFPVRLIDGTPIELVAGDDVQKATQQGILKEMRLRLNVANIDESEGITIKINGVSVPQENIERVDAETLVPKLAKREYGLPPLPPSGRLFEAAVTAPPIQRGINHIVILPGVNSIGRLSSTVNWMELLVRYR